MVQTLIRLLIKKNITTPQGRQSTAMLCSVVSVLLNLILFTGKLIGGAVSSSVAMTADAFNNLADGGTCLAELLGFRIAGIGAGRKHPFGHGRIEWLMGLFAAIAVLFMGYEMIKTSIGAILSPQPVVFGVPVIAVLIGSIAVKLYMFLYNRKYGIKIGSISMQAKAYDCIGDIAATAAVLLSSLITQMTGWQIDGWCGLVVSVFILYAGFQALNETVSPLIGNAPDKVLIEQIEQMARTYPEVIDVYDVMVHDYGFRKLIASCHVGGGVDGDVKRLVHIANELSYRLLQELGCEATIQVDLINTEQTLYEQVFSVINAAVRDMNTAIETSKIRIIQNTLFPYICVELLMPIRLAKNEDELQRTLEAAIHQLDERYSLLLKTKVYTATNKHKKID